MKPLRALSRLTVLATTCTATMMIVAACGLVIDPDVLIAGGAGLADTAPPSDIDGSDGSSSGGDGPSPDGPIIDPNCKPTGAEVCNDGFDNDCNGFTDCTDPACTAGFACIDPVPAGWTPIALADATRPNCPKEHTAQTDVRVLAGDGAHTCQCDCNGSCTNNITLLRGTDNTCAVGTTSFSPNTNCSGVALDLLSFSQVTAGGATCAQNNLATKTNPTSGRICVPPTTVGGGCAAGGRCLPKATGYAQCVAKPGIEVCPPIFTKRRRVGPTITDGRTCSGCTCNAGTCSVQLELWTQPNCNAGIDATLRTSTHGTCAASSAVANVKSYKSTTTGGCTQATPSVPGGALDIPGEQTICCK